jgi:hypothetical protein
MNNARETDLGRFVEVNDTMQSDYTYELIEPIGEEFDAVFQRLHPPH